MGADFVDTVERRVDFVDDRCNADAAMMLKLATDTTLSAPRSCG